MSISLLIACSRSSKPERNLPPPPICTGALAVIDGERTKLQVAQFKLSHGRAFFLRAYLLQTREMLFDAHRPTIWVSIHGVTISRGLHSVKQRNNQGM
jgi:hypothetical protein